MRISATAAFLLLFPTLGLAQGSSNDPNILLLEAHQKFGQAAAMQGQGRIEILRDVSAILKRIRTEFPQSAAAQKLRDGAGPEGANPGVIARAIAAADAPATIPAATQDAITRVAGVACRNAVPACQGDIAADLDLIVGHLFADTTRAVDVEANRLLFSDPGRIGSAAERAVLFADVLPYMIMTNRYGAQPDLLPTVLKQTRHSLVDDQVVTDFGLSLATALLSDLLAQHFEATGQAKSAAQTRDWIVPLVDVSLLRADSATITEPMAEESWMRSFLGLVELGAKWQASDQAGPILDLQLKKLIAEMHSIHQTLRTGVLVGYLFDATKDLDDPFLFGATDNIPLGPKLEDAMRLATRAQAELQAGWLRDNQLGAIHEIDALLEPVRQLAATAPASAAPAQVRAKGPWGPEVVAREADYDKVFACETAGSLTAQHDCALQQGVPAAAVAFSRAVESPDGVILATDFTELGAVDMVSNGIAAAAFTYLVNGDPDLLSIELPDPKAWYGDDMALAAFAGYPQLAADSSFVEGHRVMPGGGQRFVVVDRIRAVCDGCSIVGHGFRHVDFDASGKLLGARAAGFLPTENSFAEDGDAQMLRADPRWLQYRLTRLGYTPGMIDGRPGPNTRAALAEFAREHCASAQLGDDTLITETLANADPMAPAPCAGVSATPPVAAAPGALIGWYEGNPDTGMTCTSDWAPLRLYTDRILFHESGCDLDTPLAVDFTDHSTAMTCHGEGESWKESIRLLRPAPDRLSVVKNGHSFDYTFCAQTPTEEATRAPAAPVRALIGRYGGGAGTELSCDTGTPVTLYTDRILFHESGCDLDTPVAADFTDHSTAMTCHGEGDSWTEDIRLLRRTPDGLTLVKDGYSFDYSRCPD